MPLANPMMPAFQLGGGGFTTALNLGHLQSKRFIWCVETTALSPS
jgi:hypothetical protein